MTHKGAYFHLQSYFSNIDLTTHQSVSGLSGYPVNIHVIENTTSWICWPFIAVGHKC